MPTLKTRKPIDRLELEDLAVFPIWEFAVDEEGSDAQDETWVRPLDTKTIAAGLYSLSVAAEFCTVSGQVFRGLVEVTTAGGLQLGSGAILFNNTYIFVPSSDYPQASSAREEAASALGLEEASVFPLAFRLSVPLEGARTYVIGQFR